jgi:hypothetical protein
MLFFSFSNAGPISSKWRFFTSGGKANALQAKGDTCSVCDGEGSDVTDSAAGAAEGDRSYELEYFFHSFRRYDFKLTLSQREFLRKTRAIFGLCLAPKAENSLPAWGIRPRAHDVRNVPALKARFTSAPSRSIIDTR